MEKLTTGKESECSRIGKSDMFWVWAKMSEGIFGLIQVGAKIPQHSAHKVLIGKSKN